MEEKTKFCKHCGAQIPEDAVICTKCGRQVEKMENDAPNVVINNSSTSVSGANAQATATAAGGGRARDALCLCCGKKLWSRRTIPAEKARTMSVFRLGRSC